MSFRDDIFRGAVTNNLEISPEFELAIDVSAPEQNLDRGRDSTTSKIPIFSRRVLFPRSIFDQEIRLRLADEVTIRILGFLIPGASPVQLNSRS